MYLKVLYKILVCCTICDDLLSHFFPLIVYLILYFAEIPFVEMIYQIDRWFSSFFCSKHDPCEKKKAGIFFWSFSETL